MGIFGGNNKFIKYVGANNKDRFLQLNSYAMMTVFHKEGLPLPKTTTCQIYLTPEKVVIDSNIGISFEISNDKVINIAANSLHDFTATGPSYQHTGRLPNLVVAYLDRNENINYIVLERGDWAIHCQEFMNLYIEASQKQRFVMTNNLTK